LLSFYFSVRSDAEELHWQLRRQELHKGNDTTSRYITKCRYRLSNDLIDYQTTPLNTDGLTVAEAIGDPQYFPN
jgi:hypothetical protein